MQPVGTQSELAVQNDRVYADEKFVCDFVIVVVLLLFVPFDTVQHEQLEKTQLKPQRGQTSSPVSQVSCIFGHCSQEGLCAHFK